MRNVNYKIFGKSTVDIVIEMGLGACLGEWIPVAEYLAKGHGVLLYERAGINNSEESAESRTPKNIARELNEFLSTIPHEKKVILLAHSQGGLYAQQYARMYPETVKGLVLLDPLSANDNKFKESLSKEEYNKSGVDKSANFKLMYQLAKVKLGFLTKMILKKAPPFYYYKEYDRACSEDILNAVKKTSHAVTAWNEYNEAHIRENVIHLQAKSDFPDIPIVLVTHSSALAIQENMKFGNNTEEFAGKIETMWQRLMKEYLEFSDRSIWMEAKNSTHYIHLMDRELLPKAIDWVNEHAVDENLPEA